MLSQNEHTALNLNQSLPLSLYPPPHLFLSSSQPTEEQGTAGHGTMCEREGHLTKRGLSLAVTTNQPPSFCSVSVCG